MKSQNIQKYIIYFLYVLLASIGGYLTFYSMKWGPWAFSDSSAYISAARNIAAGKGFVIHQSSGVPKALTEFPPFYPMVLSLLGKTELDYISTIRWFNIFLFFSSIILFSQILYISTRNHVFSIIATLFFIFSPQIISTYTSAMSEPLFLFLLLISIFLLQLYIKDVKKIFRFFFYIISSLLPITRYAGVLFVGIFGISQILIIQKAQFIQKIKNLIIYYLIAFLPVGFWIWSLYNRLNILGGKYFLLKSRFLQNFSGSIIDEIKITKLWIPYIDIYQETITGNIIESIVTTILILLIGWVIKIFLFSNGDSESNNKQFFYLIIFLVTGYIIFIGVTHSITIPQIDINDRTMIPIYPLGLFLIFYSIEMLIRTIDKKRIFIIFIVAFLFIGLRYNVYRTNSYTKSMHSDGYGFTSRVYQQSGLINEIRKIPYDREMISNSSGFVLFYTNRSPINITNFRNYSYGLGSSYGEKPFRENHAALILLFSDFYNSYGDNSKNILSNVTNSLKVEYIDTEGGIYSYQ